MSVTSQSFGCAGAVLAGGQSTRMGQPKEGVILPDGRKMIEPILTTLAAVCQPVVIVGACRGFVIPPESGILHLPDEPSPMGPLAAIRTLLKSGIHQKGYIMTACDQPFLTTALLRLLMTTDADQPRLLEYHTLPLPFPGYYPVSWLSVLDRAFGQGERSVCDLLQTGAVTQIPFPAAWKEQLKNINTPADL